MKGDRGARSPLWRYEQRSEPVLPRGHFVRRLVAHGAFAGGLVLGSLLLGTLGYRLTEGMRWIDALLNAAMILSGMGPVGDLHTSEGKLFATAYSLFSGVMFLAIAGVLFAPLAHRLLHRLHLEGREGR